MLINVIDSSDVNALNAWQNFVQEQPASNLCQHIAWQNIIAKTFGHAPYYLIAQEQSEIVGVLPLFFVKSLLFGKGLISLPYLNAGGAVAKHAKILNALHECARAWQQKLGADYLELRLEFPLEDDSELLVRQHKVKFVLDLPSDSEELFKFFSAKLRSQIKRPIKAGASVRIIFGDQVQPSDIVSFYKIFARHNRDLGTPVYPQSLFENVLEAFKDQAFLAFVHLDGQLTSAALVVKQGVTAEIIWAASLRRFHSCSVNMLLYWGVMQQLCADGCKHFDFGRTSYDGGGYQFKKQWGGQEVPLYWYYAGAEKYIPEVNPKSSKFSLATKVWQKLPLCCVNKFGPLLTKHLP